MIDLKSKELAIVKRILKQHVPDVIVKAFGSRVSGEARTYSDLDLVLIAKEKVSVDTLNALRFAFSDSDLSIMVDIVDWCSLSAALQEKIKRDAVQIFP